MVSVDIAAGDGFSLLVSCSSSPFAFHAWLTSGTEGLITIVASVFLFFAISDFPEEVDWLTGEEKAFIRQRLSEDVGDSGHHAKYNTRDILGVFKDRECCASTIYCSVLTLDYPAKIIVGGLMYLGQIVPGCECEDILAWGRRP